LTRRHNKESARRALFIGTERVQERAVSSKIDETVAFLIDCIPWSTQCPINSRSECIAFFIICSPSTVRCPAPHILNQGIAFLTICYGSLFVFSHFWLYSSHGVPSAPSILGLSASHSSLSAAPVQWGSQHPIYLSQ
jgi:hypothetical protein